MRYHYPFLRATCVVVLAASSAFGCGDDPPETLVPSDVVDVETDADVADDVTPDTEEDATDTAEDAELDVPWPEQVTVVVTVDGEPAQNSIVAQGGTGTHYITDENGEVVVDVDFETVGDLGFTASHPEARIGWVGLERPADRVEIALSRYDASDNDEYLFQDPGTPRNSPTTAQCGHCHITLNRDWYNSPHRTAASNRSVQDLYRGGAFAFDDSDSCENAGGTWLPSPALGNGSERDRCFIGSGVVPTLNPECDGPYCSVEETGACADCHAPGIDGPLGGNDLRDATGHAFSAGVHCDVCHRVDSIDPQAPAGVGGRLVLTRPSEPRTGPLGPWSPLIFGPSHDSPNPRMGSVQRDHYRDGTLCSGCHELRQPVLVPGAQIDVERWPDGVLPIHSTWTEWEEGPLSEATPCNACHMPPEAADLNGANLEDFPLTDIGVQGGWTRAPGSVRHHSWVGPRTEESRMLQVAAALFVEVETVDGVVTARVRTKNVGPAHAIPTGEPLRSLLLTVEAFCGDEALPATGGDLVPDYGGASDYRTSAQGFAEWPSASVGDRVVGVRTTGDWYDYTGYGPFGDGRFSVEERGLPRVELAWRHEVEDVSESGEVTLSGPTDGADGAYLISDPAELAGSPGFGFARVLAGQDGRRMVPHFEAVDVVSDNRLLPQEDWTSEHSFQGNCETPTVVARLIHRPYPLTLARERGWDVNDQVMVEVRR